ncbi:hypothetical protein OESDEN_25178 [Oesophagostomum dentatum]|uniref:Uncharacterized protein n=1 Tax=Oesophagostomum dentatum TaxID=61180 RepID=A0A0B1RU95_OESDE|nr:hypothetical protein OESDEN_25178 [Oesophagostomum dentatum]
MRIGRTSLNPAQRVNYLKDAVPRIVGLYRKMNVLVYGLAEIYGFTGVAGRIFANLIRPMQLSAVISAALDGARDENDTKQYEKVLALAKEVMNMDSYFNRTITKHANG